MRVQRGSVGGSSIPELVPQAASNATQHFVDPRRYGSSECTILDNLLNFIFKQIEAIPSTAAIATEEHCASAIACKEFVATRL